MKNLLKDMQGPVRLEYSDRYIKDDKYEDFEEFGDPNLDNKGLINIDTKYSFNIKNILNERIKSTSVSTKSNKDLECSSQEELKVYNILSQPKIGSRLELDVIQNGDCKKILIVDDLAFNLLALEGMFKNKFNITPDKAFSGDESINKVKQKLLSSCCKSYRLILMDYYMPPGINGSEASFKIKQILERTNQDSYIGGLTSQREGDFAFNKSLKNFDGFYSKPIQPEEIKQIMQKLF